MIEVALLLPNLVRASLDSADTGEHLLRDGLALLTVVAISRVGTSAPRQVYVALALYVLFAEIINDVAYRILPRNETLKRGWCTLQKEQTREGLARLIELRCEKLSLASRARSFGA